ncbi:MAG: hypothetical protein WC494_00425 [Candidatus Pacearchaeota archaeon]
MEKKVWKFTNQRELNKKEFINYFERKIFRTIRKYGMLPKDRIILLKKSDNLNYLVLKRVLGGKFKVKFSNKPNFSSENLSECAERIFINILKGKFTGPKPKDKISRPLYFLSDKEIELYAKIKNIYGGKRKSNRKIGKLIDKFSEKNQDIEINIVNAMEKIFRKDL